MPATEDDARPSESGALPAAAPLLADATPPPRLDPGRTRIWAALWVGLVVFGWSGYVELDPIWLLHYPSAAAERVASRDLELAESVATLEAPLGAVLEAPLGAVLEAPLGAVLEAPLGVVPAAPLGAVPAAPLGAVLEALLGDRDETLAAAIDVHADVLAAAEEDGLPLDEPVEWIRARLALLLAESGDPAGARDALAGAPAPPGFERWLAARYPVAGADTSAAETGVVGADRIIRAAQLQDWFADRVAIRDAVALGDAALARELTAGASARAAPRRDATAALLALNWSLVVAGALLLVVGWRRVRGAFTPAVGRAPWSLADGVGVFVRGDFWSRLYFVALSWHEDIPGATALLASPAGVWLESWGTLIAGLPLLWLVHRHLLAPAGLGWRTGFGAARGPAAIAGVAFAAAAIDIAGTTALGWATWGLGVHASWTEGFDEMLVWATEGRALLVATDYVVWAPALEELAFRGVLYASLRRRLGPPSAALASGVFFSLMHFYSVPGFLATLWSGLVWAIAFERTRSLLPGIGAHALYNLLYVLGLWIAYR